MRSVRIGLEILQLYYHPTSKPPLSFLNRLAVDENVLHDNYLSHRTLRLAVEQEAVQRMHIGELRHACAT